MRSLAGSGASSWPLRGPDSPAALDDCARAPTRARLLGRSPLALGRIFSSADGSGADKQCNNKGGVRAIRREAGHRDRAHRGPESRFCDPTVSSCAMLTTRSRRWSIAGQMSAASSWTSGARSHLLRRVDTGDETRAISQARGLLSIAVHAAGGATPHRPFPRNADWSVRLVGAWAMPAPTGEAGLTGVAAGSTCIRQCEPHVLGVRQDHLRGART